MDPEIQKYLKIALDSGVGSYYRKDAIRHLGRVRKSVELTNAIIQLLKEVDDPSLQREVMDLTAQFALTEAVNILLPISLGKGLNARNAINALAKIGGIQAYNSLKKIASTPGFDLSKTAAKRALEDMLRREPNLAKEEEKDPSIIESAKGVFSDIKDKVLGEEKEAAVSEKEDPAQEIISSLQEEPEIEEPEVKQAKKVDSSQLSRELKSLQSKNDSLERKLSEKTAKIEELEEKIRKFKKESSSGKEIKDLKKQVHEGRNESAALKAAFEKQVALLKGKLISLEEENDDLLKRHRRKLSTTGQSAKKGGCLPFIIFLVIFIFAGWFIFSKATSSSKFDELRDKLNIEFSK